MGVGVSPVDIHIFNQFFSLPLGEVRCLKIGLHLYIYIYLIPVCPLKRGGVRPVSGFGLFRVNLLAMTTNFNASNSPHGGLPMKFYGTPPQKSKIISSVP